MRVVSLLFYLFLGALLVGGFAIVAVQFVGVLTLAPSLVIGVSELLANATFVAATLCSLCAFVLTYRKRTGQQVGESG